MAPKSDYRINIFGSQWMRPKCSWRRQQQAMAMLLLLLLLSFRFWFSHWCNAMTVFTTWLHLCASPWIHNTCYGIGVAEAIDWDAFLYALIRSGMLIAEMISLLLLVVGHYNPLFIHAIMIHPNIHNAFIKLCDEF